MSDNEEPQRDEGNAEQTFQESMEETQRLTTQWSVEDEEEAARERRRRERQQQLGSEGQSPEDLDDDNCTEANNHVGLKPAGPWETEEDEGFSDWSQKLEQRKLREVARATEEREHPRFTGEEPAEEPRATEELHTYEAEVKGEEETPNSEEVAEVTNETQFYTEETEAVSHSQWAASEFHDEEEVEPNRIVLEEETERQEEQEERDAPDEDQLHAEKPDGRWQSEAVERRRQSLGTEEDEDTITVRVTERAENLNRSIQKSNSIKRSEPPLPINKIDDRLEQYTHAIETSTKLGRLVRQPSLELLSPEDAVSNIKTRWETGDVTTATKASPCKDTEGINIGVSDMIHQWGKGKSEPDGNTSPQKITEVKPGDVLSKKSLWEQGPKSGQNNKNATPTKKYKFVPTGHGKYEKVLVDEP
ncbi:lymphocyte-specific protein 1 [Gastrophryne carolinensis]